MKIRIVEVSFVLNSCDHWSKSQGSLGFNSCTIAELSWWSSHIMFSFLICKSQFPASNLERERGWKLFFFLSLHVLLTFLWNLSGWGLCGLAVRSWGNKWLLLFYMESSLHFLEKQSPERQSCCLKPLRMNDRASQSDYFFTAVTFTSKSYLSVGWFCTQPWDMTYTSILYSL